MISHALVRVFTCSADTTRTRPRLRRWKVRCAQRMTIVEDGGPRRVKATGARLAIALKPSDFPSICPPSSQFRLSRGFAHGLVTRTTTITSSWRPCAAANVASPDFQRTFPGALLVCNPARTGEIQKDC